MSAVGQAAVGAAGGPLSKSARDLACGDDFLEGRLCARKESFTGFGQADTARCAYAASTTLMPDAAIWLANSWPMPDDAPVTSRGQTVSY